MKKVSVQEVIRRIIWILLTPFALGILFYVFNELYEKYQHDHSDFFWSVCGAIVAGLAGTIIGIGFKNVNPVREVNKRQGKNR